MKVIFKKLKRRNKFEVFIYIGIIILYLLGYVFFTKNILALTGIETILRIILILVFLIYFGFYIFWNLINIITKRHKLFIFTTIITSLIIAIFAASSIVIDFLYDNISGLGENKNVVYTSYLITLKDTEFDSDCSIGMINENEDKEVYTLANRIIKDNKLSNKVQNYDDYLAMLNDLYDKKIDAIFVQSNYVTLYNSEEKFLNLGTDTKIVYKESLEMENTDVSIVSTKDFNEPISILVMGVDSTTDGLNANAAFNGDTLMLVTLNPNTLNATMFSIPRDTYVPIACKKNSLAKINSSVAYGTDCVIKTVENFTNIDIDYYVKINFKGVVDLVDALGGVEVEVEPPDIKTYGTKVCEQDSNRQFGSNLVCMDSGYQKLNGEQALAYSRCRHLYLTSDLARIKHQQDVVTAIGQKAVTLRSFKDFEKVVNAVTKNISTNMSTEQILSAYNLLKSMIQNAISGEEFITINKTYLEVYNLRVYIQASKMYTSALGYYPDSLDAIVDAMKVNLEIKKQEIVKTFSFSANEEYVVKAIGEGIRTGKIDSTLPNFENSSVGFTKAWCTKNNITCNFELVESDSENYNPAYGNDVIGKQSIHDGALMSNVKTITFYVNKASEKKEEPTNNNESSEDKKEESNDLNEILSP